MLQQTRAETVTGRYESFLQRFPDVKALAAASRQEVLAQWEGLGYYQRAHRLHEAARRIEEEMGGRWPSDYDVIAALPGVGEYTASAVASIAFDEPRAAVDGNALRVLARFANDPRDPRRGPARRDLAGLGAQLAGAVPPGRRGDFTQALMELGATVCIPRSPRCGECPWKDQCAGHAAGTAAELPSTRPRKQPLRVVLSIGVVRRGDTVLVRRRGSGVSVLPGFWELPHVEGKPLQMETELGLRPNPGCLGRFAHAITSTRYTCRVYRASLAGPLRSEFRWTSAVELRELPVTTISRKSLALARETDFLVEPSR